MGKNDSNKNPYGYRRTWLSVTAIIIVVIFLIWTIASSLIGVWASDDSSQTSASDSMRGVWVSTIYGLDYPSQATTDEASLKSQLDAILDNCEKMHMNAIFFQVRPSSDAFYDSDIFPWSKYLTGTQGQAPSGGFDPLEYMVEGAHARGIELHAWINPYRITQGGEADWQALSADNPAKGTMAQYVKKYGENYYYDPGEPAVRQLIEDGVTEILENYDVDGIHLDDYFYPGTDFDDSATYAKYGGDFTDLAAWRRDNVNMLIQELDTIVHKAGKNLRFGVSPTGIWANSSSVTGGSATSGTQHYISRYADSVTWIKNGWVDYIAPQIYWYTGYQIADYLVLAQWWNDIVEGTDVDLYIGMADYKAASATDPNDSWYGTKEIERQLSVNASYENIKGEIHFRYKFLVSDSALYDLYEYYYGELEKEDANGSGSSSGTTGSGSGSTGSTDSQSQIGDASGSQGDASDTYGNTDSTLTDISDHWACSYITELVSDGILTGMGDGTFQPEASVTRAQFVKMIASMVESVAGEIDFDTVKDAGFTDLEPRAWYVPYVNWAAGAGIVSGVDAKNFRPDDQITREQMAVIIKNLADVLETDFGAAGSMIDFSDAGEIDSWAESAVIFAVKAGILNGTASVDKKGNATTSFNPLANATRAQAAKVIYVVRGLIPDLD